MPSSFEILARFLDRFSVEVEGRSLQEPTADIKRKLQAFARGTLTDAERGELIPLLRQNPHWISLLADEAKAMRPAGAKTQERI